MGEGKEKGMSLDVYLDVIEPILVKNGSGIFVRENGMTREISREEWNQKHPGCEPIVVNRDEESCHFFTANITHNLGRMAKEAGIYEELWRPDEIAIGRAFQLIEPLKRWLALMRSDPERFKAFNATNGWGTYKQFVPWIEKYLEACQANPNAEVSVSR